MSALKLIQGEKSEARKNNKAFKDFIQDELITYSEVHVEIYKTSAIVDYNPYGDAFDDEGETDGYCESIEINFGPGDIICKEGDSLIKKIKQAYEEYDETGIMPTIGLVLRSKSQKKTAKKLIAIKGGRLF